MVLKISSRFPSPDSLSFFGVSLKRSLPFDIIAALVHTASTSSRICVDITIVLFYDIFLINSRTSYF